MKEALLLLQFLPAPLLAQGQGKVPRGEVGLFYEYERGWRTHRALCDVCERVALTSVLEVSG